MPFIVRWLGVKINKKEMKKAVGIIGMFLIYSALVAQGDAKTRVYEVWDDQPVPNRGKDYSWIKSIAVWA